MGHSPHHSRDISLVLDLTTGDVSPQYHLVLDKAFATVSEIIEKPTWQGKAYLEEETILDKDTKTAAHSNPKQKMKMDYLQAYPQAPIGRPMYMNIPPEFMIPDHLEYNNRDHCLEVLQNIYGQKQSGRAWNKYLFRRLKSIGFTQSKYYSCIFYRRKVNFSFGSMIKSAHWRPIAVQTSSFLASGRTLLTISCQVISFNNLLGNTSKAGKGSGLVITSASIISVFRCSTSAPLLTIRYSLAIPKRALIFRVLSFPLVESSRIMMQEVLSCKRVVVLISSP